MSLKNLKNRKPLFIATILLAMVFGAVIAQLLSNRIDQTIVIRGEDESYLLTATNTFAGTEWVNIGLTSTIKVERIRAVSGTMNIQIENLDNSSFLAADILLEISYRDAANQAYSGFMPFALSQINGTIVGFSETVWFDTGETTSYYSLQLTWYSSAPGGNYQVSVFVES